MRTKDQACTTTTLIGKPIYIRVHFTKVNYRVYKGLSIPIARSRGYLSSSFGVSSAIKLAIAYPLMVALGM